MNGTSDFDRLLAGWLADADPGPLSTAISRAALAEARTRPYHRGWRTFRRLSWPRRAGGLSTLLATGLLAALAVGLATVGQLPSPIPADHGVFTLTGSLSAERGYATATTLLDGRVLVTGGYTGPVAGDVLDTAEIWDPASGTFSATGRMTQARDGHSTVLLRDGRVLVVGGVSEEGIASAEIWDPHTGAFRVTGALAHGRAPRYGGRLTLLPGDRVLVTGGLGGDGALESPEIWDPLTETWSPADPSVETRRPPGVDLADGRVLIIDGEGARLWDPGTETTVRTGSPAVLRDVAATDAIGILLPDGRVLVAGGYPTRGGQALASAEIWDAEDGMFHPTGSMSHTRSYAAATLLHDGRVLVVGGPHESSAELFGLDGDGSSASPP